MIYDIIDLLTGIAVIVGIIYLCHWALTRKNSNHYKNDYYYYQPKQETPPEDSGPYFDEDIEKGLNDINLEIEKIQYIKGAYMSKWMFTQNEKQVYYKLNEIAKRNDLILFAKVRLFDLVTPINGHPKYKTNLYKIQAKHVDFVLTKNNLVAKYIIELDDNSHNTNQRKERDKFVDTVLSACGYKVLHIRGVDTDKIQAFIDSGK